MLNALTFSLTFFAISKHISDQKFEKICIRKSQTGILECRCFYRTNCCVTQPKISLGRGRLHPVEPWPARPDRGAGVDPRQRRRLRRERRQRGADGPERRRHAGLLPHAVAQGGSEQGHDDDDGKNTILLLLLLFQGLFHSVAALSGPVMASYLHWDKRPGLYGRRLARELGCDPEEAEKVVMENMWFRPPHLILPFN